MDLYKRFLSKDNFELAYFRLKYGPNNTYKYFYKSDIDCFGIFLSKNVDQLINEVTFNVYEPQKVCRYYVPKKNCLSRPISLLNFIDLMVYQALANVLMREVDNEFSMSDNRYVFANVINRDENNRFFQFNDWRNQWKIYQNRFVKNHNEGYYWIAEFDIASFYDLIDLDILLSSLRDRGIDYRIIELLSKCFRKWTQSYDDFSREKRCGIPQGPECSGFFAELYLRLIDEKIIKKLGDVKYIRYADDIKLMAKNEKDCQRGVALLDYYCKDLSLIAQSSKLVIKSLKEINIHHYVNRIGLKLSNIALEFKRKGSINERTHNKLKKKLFRVFEKDDELYLDKTFLKFVFFKFNKDDDIKELILNNIELLYLTLEGPIYYLNKYFPNDCVVLKKMKEILLSDNVIFQYNKAVIFDKFKALPFDDDVYESLVGAEKDRFWIVKYFAIKWLKRLNEDELIRYLPFSKDNYFIDREVFFSEINRANSDILRKQISKEYYNKQAMLALTAFFWCPIKEITEDTASNYILNILSLDKSDFIRDYLKSNYGIKKRESKKFVKSLQSKESVYREAIYDLIGFEKDKNGLYPENALMNLDLFHNIIVDIIMDNDGDMGSKIARMGDDLSIVKHSFKIIHNARNQKTLAHYKDEELKVRKKINSNELDKLIKKAKLGEAYLEIVGYFNKLD